MANSIICQVASTCRVDAGLPNSRCSVHPRCAPNQQRTHTFMWCDDLVEFDGARMSKFLKKSWVKDRNVEPEQTEESLADRFETEVMRHAKRVRISTASGPRSPRENPSGRTENLIQIASRPRSGSAVDRNGLSVARPREPRRIER